MQKLLVFGILFLNLALSSDAQKCKCHTLTAAEIMRKVKLDCELVTGDASGASCAKDSSPTSCSCTKDCDTYEIKDGHTCICKCPGIARTVAHCCKFAPKSATSH